MQPTFFRYIIKYSLRQQAFLLDRPDEGLRRLDVSLDCEMTVVDRVPFRSRQTDEMFPQLEQTGP